MDNQFAPPLEAYMDKVGLAGVLALLSAIAGEKAEHIRTNWQDEHLATTWEQAMLKLDKLAASFRRQNL